jgi:hypothetical protein
MLCEAKRFYTDRLKLDANYLIMQELYEAEKKHPIWPKDIIHQIAILVEESGEAMREALNIIYQDDGSYDKLKAELVQTGAMAIRCLINLKEA